MRAYHNDPAIKAKYLIRVRAHQAADEIIQGEYWKNGRGCAVGCTLHSSVHQAYKKELGIPESIAKLEDDIFEGLPLKDAKLFPARFLEAVQVGSDVSLVVPKFLHWLLIDEQDGVMRLANTEETRKSIKTVADLYQRKIDGSVIKLGDWTNARSAAYAAAYAAAYPDAAYAAAYAAAAYPDAAGAAAYAAAYAADAYAAAYAADDAVTLTVASYVAASASAAASAAAKAAYDYVDACAASVDSKQKLRIKQADKLIELLKTA